MSQQSRGSLFSWGNVLQAAQTGNANGNVATVEGGHDARLIACVMTAGSFNGTVTFQGTVDGTNWFALSGTNLTSGAAASTATADGIFRFDVSGILKFRAATSAVVAGNVTVTYTLVA